MAKAGALPKGSRPVREAVTCQPSQITAQMREYQLEVRQAGGRGGHSQKCNSIESLVCPFFQPYMFVWMEIRALHRLA